MSLLTEFCFAELKLYASRSLEFEIFAQRAVSVNHATVSELLLQTVLKESLVS